MTNFGILMPAIRPPKTIPVGDHRTLQIRSRRAKDLDILRARYMQTSLGPTLHTPDKDYEYRAYCEPAAFAMAMAQMVMEVDYLKFKPTTISHYQDHDLHSVYNSIWSVVINRLSTEKHRTEYFSKWTTPATGANEGSALPVTLPFGGGSGTSSYSVGNGSGDYSPYDGDDAGTDNQDWITEVIGRDDWADDAAQRAAEIAETLDELLNSEPPERIDHSECGHANSDSARARCRRRQLRAHEERVAEIRQLALESYQENRAQFGAMLPE